MARSGKPRVGIRVTRLRLLGLPILVVFLALIGLALLLRASGPPYEVSSCLPGHRDGYVWVPASEVPVPVLGPNSRYHYLVYGGGACAELRPAVPYENIPLTDRAEVAELAGMTVTEMEKYLHVLVPERLVKQR